MKKREPILIHIDILGSLFASPKGPAKLAQACNVNYGRIGTFTKQLLDKGLIRSEVLDGQEVFSISDERYRVDRDWLEIWRKLPLD